MFRESFSAISILVRVRPLAFPFALRCGKEFAGPTRANSRGIGCCHTLERIPAEVLLQNICTRLAIRSACPESINSACNT